MINETLYVVSCFFNPRRAKSRPAHYRDFRSYMEFSGVKLFTTEVALGDYPFEVTEANNPYDLQLRSDEEIWHKERALNLAIQELLKLVPDAKYIAWIDGDVRFSNPRWAQDTIRALQYYQVVQPFSEAQSLNPKFESQWKTPGLFANYVRKIGYSQTPPLPISYTGGGHPGLAWAARRETLEQLGGLMDFCVHGSADTHMANALMGDVTMYIRYGLKGAATPGFIYKIEEWASRCNKHVKKNIGYVNGICTHYWHGKPNKRGYEKRWQLVCYHKFDPMLDLTPCLNGLFKLADCKPDFKYDLRRSLSERDEDSIDE